MSHSQMCPLASSRPPSRASKQQELLSPKLTPGRRQKRRMPNDELETLYMSYLKKKQKKKKNKRLIRMLRLISIGC